MARGGRGRRSGGGQGFGGGGADRILPNGRVRTAAGGTRNRAGALATTGSGGRRRRGNQTRGLRNGTINAGGRSQRALPGIDTGETRRRVPGTQAREAANARQFRRNTRSSELPSSGMPIVAASRAQRRANAIQNIVERGATPGERAAAVAAQARLGRRNGPRSNRNGATRGTGTRNGADRFRRGGASGGGRIAGLLPAGRGGNVPSGANDAENNKGTGLRSTGNSALRRARPGEFSQRQRGADARARLRNLARTGSPATQARAQALAARVGVRL